MKKQDPVPDPSADQPELPDKVQQFVQHIATCGAAVEGVLTMAKDQPLAAQLSALFVQQLAPPAFAQLQALVKREASRRSPKPPKGRILTL